MCPTARALIEAIKGCSADGPRGNVTSIPATRDMVNDEHAIEVIAGRTASSATKVLGTIHRLRMPVRSSRLAAVRNDRTSVFIRLDAT